MSRSATLCLPIAFTLLVQGACGNGSEAPAIPGGPVDVSTIGSKRLDALTAEEVSVLCREGARRSDACIESATTLATEALCTSALEECRSGGADPGGSPDCTGIDLGSPGSCATTVGEYLACVEAWTSSMTCANAGRLVRTPEACMPLVTQCGWLASAFYRGGKPFPCVAGSGVSKPPDTNDDVYGFDGCRPIPQRFAVLGDSIPACIGSDGFDGSCSPQLVAEELARRAPGLRSERHAIPGAFVADLPSQAALVEPGPGHLVVYIWAIGNDLLQRSVDYDGWTAAFRQVFDYFTDTARFPDGVTFLFNAQYSPLDECFGVPGTQSAYTHADELNLQEVNRRLFLDVAEQRSDTVAIDHYPDWLGHGRNADVEGCPHCGADNTSWMADQLHPNALGHQHITAKWRLVFERMYGQDCPQPSRSTANEGSM